MLLLPLLFLSITGLEVNRVAGRPPTRDTYHIAPRDTTNGSCISAPEDACASLVALCVNTVVIGQVPSDKFWQDPVCVAAATCAGVGPLLDAACCAGTCMTLLDMQSLDYTLIYAPMVGSCAWATGGCPVTWTDYVNWFYNTIQATGTNNWPISGDDVLGWWQQIATWTAFCSGDRCSDGKIPYLNFNDWFHYSSSTIVTTPGNPPTIDPLSTDRDDNSDDWDPTSDWPCPFDDPTLCVYDYGPETTAGLPTTERRSLVPNATSFAKRAEPLSFRDGKITSHFQVPSGARAQNASSLFLFGYAPHQPENVPPPVFINGTIPVPLTLKGGQSTVAQPQDETSGIISNLSAVLSNVDLRPAALPLAPGTCLGSIDPITSLPVLTYYCDFLPNICAGIRASGYLTDDQIVLTYDPFGSGARRRAVCPRPLKAEFQAMGKCDLRRHDPNDWLVSCDEFPFNSALEGGVPNAKQTVRVPTREQGYQGTLQSSITRLLRVQNDRRTLWAGPTGKMCHPYILKLVDGEPPIDAPDTAIGSLQPNGAFLPKFDGSNGAEKYLTDSRRIPPPVPAEADFNYLSTQSALKVPGNSRKFDCTPCFLSGNVPVEREISTPTEYHEAADVIRRATPTCTATTSAIPPTTTPQATDQANADIAEAVTAAAAAAAALTQTAGASAAAIAAAGIASGAASALAIAAGALVSAATDSALASAIASVSAGIESAQGAVAAITSMSSVPASIQAVADQVSITSSAISSALDGMANVINPQTPIPPPTDPARDPNTNSAGGPNVAAAKCFGAGSTGFLKIGSTFVVDGQGNAPATLVDAGSPAYFGLTIPTNRYLSVIANPGCSGVYAWVEGPLQPSFQVNCSTNEFGSFWNTNQQQCYAYFITSTTFDLFCSNNLGTIYSCIQAAGLFATLTPAFVTWVSG